MPAVLVLVPFLLLGAAEEGAGPAFTVAGTVRADAPVKNARVQVFDSLAPSVLLGETHTGDDGTFAVQIGMDVAQAREHPWAPVLVRVDADGYARRATECELGGGSVGIALVPPVVRSGKLVDGDGNPVPGAFLLATQPGTGVEVLVTSDENGAFTIDSLGPEPVSVRIRAPGFEQEELFRVDEAAMPIVLQPIPGDAAGETVVLQGRVLDEEGGPVAGARVTTGDRGAWTDARGEWRLELPRTGMTTLDVTAPAKAPRRVTLRTDRAGRIDLRVVDGATIEGRVVDESGAPVFGAMVGAYTAAGVEPASWDAVISGRRLAVAWSGPDGVYVLRGVPPAAERLLARGHGRGSAPLPLPAGDAVRLVLREELPTSVHVTDDRGRPLPSVLVGLRGIASVWSVAEETDEEGWFRADLSPDMIAEASVDTEPGGPPACVEPGGTIELVVPLDHGDASIRYAVEGPDQWFPSPDETFPVEARLVHAEFARRLVGSSGVFEHLATGRYELTVTAEGFLPETRTLVIDRPDQELSVSIALRRAGEVTLTASPGARVLVQTVSGEPAPLARLELPDGTQVVQGFGPGTYRFVSRADGELIVVRKAAIAPDGEPFGIDLRAGAASTLAVEVKDRAGTPVEGAALTLRTPGGFEYRTGRNTDAAGRATLDALIEGDVDVYAALGDRLGAGRITVTPGAELRVVVTLP